MRPYKATVSGRTCLSIVIAFILVVLAQSGSYHMLGSSNVIIKNQSCTDAASHHSVIKGGRGTDYQYTNDNDMTIPQPSYDSSNPGQVESEIIVPESYQIEATSVYVGISHPYIGDLVVAVVPPWAQNASDAVVLHNREGGDADDIYKTYNETTTPALSQFTGHNAMGTWKLVVQDWARHIGTPSSGYLDIWTLYLHGNSRPSQPIVDVIPDSPTGDDVLVATAISNDDDGDNLVYQYKWYRNGNEMVQIHGNTVQAEDTVVGDIWKCVVVATDGEATSEPGYDQVVIGNEAPTEPEIELLPAAPRTNDNITLRIVKDSYDPDGGSVSYIIKWKLNSNVVDEETNMTYFSSNLTKKGDRVECIVMPYDSTYSFGPHGSFNLTVANSPPTNVDSFSPLITSNTKPRFSWFGADDIDGDPVYYWVSMGTEPGSSDVIPWHLITNDLTYTPEDRLEKGLYFFNIIANDTEDNSTMNSYRVEIDPQSTCTPPGPISDIYPHHTADRSPLVYWDPVPTTDGRDIIYYIRAGSTSGSDDILRWTRTNLLEYQFNDLDYGTYYMQLKCSDGTQESPVYEGKLIIYQESNTPPSAPTNIRFNGYPSPAVVEGNVSVISWTGSIDPDHDNISYEITIGSSKYGTDLGTFDHINGTELVLEQPFLQGSAYVSIRGMDGDSVGPWALGEVMVKKANRAPTAPYMFGPEKTHSVHPYIWWFGAWDPDGDELTYRISVFFNGNLLITDSTIAEHYTPESELAVGTYSIHITASDGKLESQEVVFKMEISKEECTLPPDIKDIWPAETQNSMPYITWLPEIWSSGLSYKIAISSITSSPNTLEWTDVQFPHYTVEDALAAGKYRIYVYSILNDTPGEPAVSELTVELKNHPPTPPVIIGPYNTNDRTLGIHWLPGLDPDGDKVGYNVTVYPLSSGRPIFQKTIWDTTCHTDTLLPYGTYSIEVRSYDGINMSEGVQFLCELAEDADTPSTPPTDFWPERTACPTPTLYWYGASDADGDALTYRIYIGSAENSYDILNGNVVSKPMYKFETELPQGTYFVYISSGDNREWSAYAAFRMIIEPGNYPPEFESESDGWVAYEGNITLNWDTASDTDGDDLVYYVSIGTVPYKTDILDWVSVGEKTYYTARNMGAGIYYVMIRASDGSDYSNILTGKLVVKEAKSGPPFTAGIMENIWLYKVDPGETASIKIEIQSNLEIPIVVHVTNSSGSSALTLSHKKTVALPPLGKKVIIINATVSGQDRGNFGAKIILSNGTYSMPLLFTIDDSTAEDRGNEKSSTQMIDSTVMIGAGALLVFLVILIVTAYVLYSSKKQKKHDHRNVIKADSVIKPPVRSKMSGKRAKGGRAPSQEEIEEIVEAEVVYEPGKNGK